MGLKGKCNLQIRRNQMQEVVLENMCTILILLFYFLYLLHLGPQAVEIDFCTWHCSWFFLQCQENTFMQFHPMPKAFCCKEVYHFSLALLVVHSDDSFLYNHIELSKPCHITSHIVLSFSLQIGITIINSFWKSKPKIPNGSDIRTSSFTHVLN